MKKIVPFTKELVFKNGISEITSIALDNTLKLDKNLVTGEFIISGTYKMIGGDLEEEFKYNIPSFVTIDTKYDTTNCQVSIDDFSYEIINEEKLRVNISLMLDDLDIKEDEIEELRKHLDSNGKLVISSDLTEKQKERYQFINELNIDLISVLKRDKKVINSDNDEEDNSNIKSHDNSDDDLEVEFLDDEYSISTSIEEDEDATIDNLDNFF